MATTGEISAHRWGRPHGGPRGGRACGALLTAVIFLGCPAAPRAHPTVVIGGAPLVTETIVIGDEASPHPDGAGRTPITASTGVVVDLGVLERAGPPRAATGALSNRIRLRPPSSTGARVVLIPPRGIGKVKLSRPADDRALAAGSASMARWKPVTGPAPSRGVETGSPKAGGSWARPVAPSVPLPVAAAKDDEETRTAHSRLDEPLRLGLSVPVQREEKTEPAPSVTVASAVMATGTAAAGVSVQRAPPEIIAVEVARDEDLGEYPTGGAEAEVQVAMLPPSSTPASIPAGSIVIPFDVGETQIPDAAFLKLRDLAHSLMLDPRLRAEVRAFATADGTTESFPRRISLSRALAIRSYLVDAGVRSTRIDVRALGDRSDNPFARNRDDRVEIVLSQ